jgi:hypothetical protein
MIKKLLIALILGIVVFYSLCAENEKTQTTPTPITHTPQKTTLIQTPQESPPPGMQTPLTPDYYIERFIEYFNEKNATELYDLFSDKIKHNHSINELETALKLAEEHNITIVKWRIIKGRFFPDNVTVEMKISKDGKIVNKTIVIPVIYRPFKKGSEIFNRGYIDDWIIDDILGFFKQSSLSKI